MNALHLYQPRTYRNRCSVPEWFVFKLCIEESDLYIKTTQPQLEDVAWKELEKVRAEIKSYIEKEPLFEHSLQPLFVADNAPLTVKAMADASAEFGVGPMAAVAGCIAEEVAQALHRYSSGVVVENGGDIFLFNEKPVVIGLYTGINTVSMKLGLCLEANPQGISICTSSGKVGHSLNFGQSDAVTVLARNGAYADAAATALANIIQSEKDIDAALDCARAHQDISGVVIVIDGKIGVRGEAVKLCVLD